MTPADYKPLGSIGLEELDQQPDPSWTIDNILVDSGIGVISGDGGHGKTWLSQLLALSVASGQKWLNHFEVRKGPVVYIDEENSGPLWKNRKNLLMKGLGLEYEDLLPIRLILHKGVDFFPRTNKDGAISCKKVWYELVKELRLWQPSLIVVDSLRACHTGQEDKSDDIRPVMNSIRQAASMAGNNSAVLIVHHTNKQGNFRGSIDIKQAANCLIEVSKKDDCISLVCAKQRDAIEFDPFKVNMVYGEEYVTLQHAGSSPIISTWDWLSTTLNGSSLSRESIIEQASNAGVCQQRKMDKELKMREEAGDIESFRMGKLKFYRLSDGVLNFDTCLDEFGGNGNHP